MLTYFGTAAAVVVAAVAFAAVVVVALAVVVAVALVVAQLLTDVNMTGRKKLKNGRKYQFSNI